MRKLNIWLLIISLVVLSIFTLTQHKSVCEQPLSYRIGIFDDRFGISEREFRESIKRAENIWENVMDLNLFEYNPSAKFAINLIFDERQKATIEKQRLNHKLKQIESSHADISKSYKYWDDIYEEKVKSYEKSVSIYEKHVKEHNTKVEYWNNNGGAPEKIYEILEKERENISKIKSQLDEDRSYINEIVDVIQSMKNRVNMISDTYKTHVETYNSYYGGNRRFNQGEYNGKAITIYQFNDSADLTLAIAHELGHALGLGHVDTPTAVMHYLMGEQNVHDLTLTQDDINALKTACGLD